MLTEDQVNNIINDQEEVIADLRSKLLDMTDERDLAIGKGLELLQSLKRIECSEDLEIAKKAAWQAIQDFRRK